MRDWKGIGPLVVLVGLLCAGAWEAGHERGDRVTGGMLLGAGLIVLGAWLSGEIREELRNADLVRARKARRALQIEQERRRRSQGKRAAAEAGAETNEERVADYTGDGEPEEGASRDEK